MKLLLNATIEKVAANQLLIGNLLLQIVLLQAVGGEMLVLLL